MRSQTVAERLSGGTANYGRLLRGYHDSAAGLDGGGLPWQRPVPARWRGPLITHNDLNPANVIFGDGTAVGLIDFDLAAPGTAAFDLAVAACFWVPLRADADITDSRRDQVFDRHRALLVAYGADPTLRRDVTAATPAANRWVADIIGTYARQGHPAFGGRWPHAMGLHRRAAQWLATHTGDLTDAGGPIR